MTIAKKKPKKSVSGKKLAPKAEKQGFFQQNKFIILSFVVPL